LCQWLQTKDGRLKLGDFNRAEFPLFDPEKQEYCKYDNGHAYGNYRSPEEFSASNLDEKIDVWSFGNNIYALLTGLWVFYENEDDAVVQVRGYVWSASFCGRFNYVSNLAREPCASYTTEKSYWRRNRIH
jgi:serine/threonine protein kinase